MDDMVSDISGIRGWWQGEAELYGVEFIPPKGIG